jgi:hypothetical protein
MDRRKFLASTGFFLFSGCAALPTDNQTSNNNGDKTSVSDGVASISDGVWRSARGDKRNTGLQETAEFGKDLLGNKFVSDTISAYTSPVADENRIYFVSDFTVYAISRDSRETDWEKEFDGLGTVSPLVTGNSLVVQAGTSLIGLHTDTGDEHWRVDLGQSDGASNLTFDNGSIIASSGDGIMRVSQDGKIEWRRQLQGFNVQGLGNSENYVVATTTSSETDKVIALSSDDGGRVWETEGIRCVIEPVLGANHVYTVAKTGRIHALSLDSGKQEWSVELDGDSILVPPALDSIRNQLIVPSGTGDLVAIDIESQSKLWQTSVDSEVRTPLGVTAESIYHFGSAYRRILPDSGEVDRKDPNFRGTGGLALTTEGLWVNADHFLIKFA